ncbi:MAG: CvpA family protein [Chitinophagales bacterium]|nr:CvpA family protein [Chitinophagales bacterium]
MWIDIVYLFFVLWAIYKGWTQGLIISIFSLLAWILGVIGALKFSGIASEYLHQQFKWNSEFVPIVSFLLVFILIALIINLIGKMLEKIIEIAHMGLINKICGVILKLLVYTFIFSILIWFINQAGWISPSVKMQSKVYASAAPVAPLVLDQISLMLPAIKDLLYNLQKFFESIPK